MSHLTKKKGHHSRWPATSHAACLPLFVKLVFHLLLWCCRVWEKSLQRANWYGDAKNTRDWLYFWSLTAVSRYGAHWLWLMIARLLRYSALNEAAWCYFEEIISVCARAHLCAWITHTFRSLIINRQVDFFFSTTISNSVEMNPGAEMYPLDSNTVRRMMDKSKVKCDLAIAASCTLFQWAYVLQATVTGHTPASLCIIQYKHSYRYIFCK